MEREGLIEEHLQARGSIAYVFHLPTISYTAFEPKSHPASQQPDYVACNSKTKLINIKLTTIKENKDTST